MNEADQQIEDKKKMITSKQLFLYLLLSFIILVASFSFLISPSFLVGKVMISGNAYMDEKEIFQIADIPEKINIFRLNTTEIQNRLYKDLRIEQAIVERQFPSTITIKIIERKPTAYVACDYGFLEVDKTGTVLAAFKSLREIKVPIVTGITLKNLYVGDKVTDSAFAAVLEYLSAIDEKILGQISEVNMANQQELFVYTTNALQIRLGNTERMQEKARLTQEFLQDEKVSKLSIEYVDFNFVSPFIKLKN